MLFSSWILALSNAFISDFFVWPHGFDKTAAKLQKNIESYNII